MTWNGVMRCWRCFRGFGTLRFFDPRTIALTYAPVPAITTPRSCLFSAWHEVVETKPPQNENQNKDVWNENEVETAPQSENETETNQDTLEEMEWKWNSEWNSEELEGSDLKQNPQELQVPPSQQRSLRVAIIGTPNAGKSTMINQLLQKKVLAVSPKVHTTLRKAVGVITEGTAQIVLMDTPGLVKRSYAKSLGLSREFIADPVRSVMEADLIMVILDAANRLTREKLDVSVLKILRHYPHLPSLLVLNKVDIVKQKSLLLKLVDILTGSDQPDCNRMGYLIRKLKNKRIPAADRAEFRKELGQLRAELATRKERKQGVLKSLKERAKMGLCTMEEVLKDGGDGDLTVEQSGGHEAQTPAGRGLEGNDHTHSEGPPAVGNCEVKEEKPHTQLGGVDHWQYFHEVFMVSALDGDGVPKLKDYLVSRSKKKEWEYSVSEVTDQPALTIVEDIIREKLCLHTGKELPYVVRQQNVIWERNEADELTIYQYLYCGKRSRANILVGHKGKVIDMIREEATRDIEDLLHCKVHLRLHVKK